MSRCLRCGAGNEWIEPVGASTRKYEEEIAQLKARIAVLEKAIQDASRLFPTTGEK